jgi:hypothetical protein
MSAAMASSTETVYVRLLNEGTDVMRPVPARRVFDDVYELTKTNDYDPEYETWQFLPGQLVRCENRGTDGILVAAAEFKGGD